MMPLARWPLWRRMALAALAGALAAFGLAPVGLWIVTLLLLPLLPVLLLASGTPRQAALSGWAFATGWFAHGLFWIIEPFFVEPEIYGWMAPFALVFMAGGLALFWGLAFGLAHRWGRTSPGRVWLLIGLLSLAEVARAYVLTGFPWAALAQIWTGSDTLLLLAWIGPQGLAVLTLAVSVLPGWAIATRAPLEGHVAALLPAFVLAAATMLAVQTKPPAPNTDFTVRVIQPNAPQHQKWDPAHMPTFFRRQVEFTAIEPRPDLIVWPESAVPALLEQAEPYFDVISQAAGGSAVVLGIRRLEGRRLFNTAVYLDGDGAVGGTYDKHHLVPFGEYVPLGDLAAQAGLHGFAARDGQGYSAGPGPQLMSLGPLGRALPLICYEAVFPQDVNGAPERPDLLLQLTNDAWFGQRSGPYQHLAQARMRAVEQGLPMIRAANTGVSAVIDPLGRVRRSIPLGEAGYADAALPAPLPPTLYARTGDLPVILLLLIGTVALVWRQTRK
ncbi:apolipoprotein N-acyltransferase [Seohaeicola saemankumensis]|nr:apolipoprotein N-acyltransferase [Seohaeicola saemankumensis]MCA0871835.1 apolipoprotein N-acyltransferase [Seohaeicola saemankumensis]